MLHGVCVCVCVQGLLSVGRAQYAVTQIARYNSRKKVSPFNKAQLAPVYDMMNLLERRVGVTPARVPAPATAPAPAPSPTPVHLPKSPPRLLGARSSSSGGSLTALLGDDLHGLVATPSMKRALSRHTPDDPMHIDEARAYLRECLDHVADGEISEQTFAHELQRVLVRLSTRDGNTIEREFQLTTQDTNM